MNDNIKLESRSHAWIGVIVTVLAFAVIAKIPFFAPDSWSYLELSNTVFGDFYRVNTIRQFVADEPYGRAFPPLWPAMIAAVRRYYDIGIYTGVAINFVVCLALLAALIRLCRRLDLPAWVGTASYLGVFACSAFLDDVLAARNCVLSLLFVTLTLSVLVRNELGAASGAFAGLWMGLACLNRFDMLPAAVAIGLLARFRAKTPSVSLVYYAVFVLVVSPWVAYSWTHFNTVWASDNTRQVLMARNVNVQNYYASAPVAVLFENRREWIVGLFTNKIPMAWKGLVFTFIHSATLTLFAVVLVVWGMGKRPMFSDATRRLASWAMWLIPLFVLPPTLVGYGDERYYLPVQLIVIVLLFAALVGMTRDAWVRGRVLMLLCVLGGAVLPGDAIPQAVKHRARLRHAPWFGVPREPTTEMRELADAVNRDAKDRAQRLAIFSPSPFGWDAYQYGALTGRPVSVVPRIATGSIESFMRDWHITHFYDGQKLGNLVDPAIVNLVPLSVPGLYRVEFRQ